MENLQDSIFVIEKRNMELKVKLFSSLNEIIYICSCHVKRKPKLFVSIVKTLLE